MAEKSCYNLWMQGSISYHKKIFITLIFVMGLLLFACTTEQPPLTPSETQLTKPPSTNPTQPSLIANTAIINQNTQLESCVIQVVATGDVKEISCTVILQPDHSQFRTEQARQQADLAWQAMADGNCQRSLDAFTQALDHEPDEALISKIYLSQQVNLARQCLAREVLIRPFDPSRPGTPEQPTTDMVFSPAATALITKGDFDLAKGYCDAAKTSYRQALKIETESWAQEQLNEKIQIADECKPSVSGSSAPIPSSSPFFSSGGGGGGGGGWSGPAPVVSASPTPSPSGGKGSDGPPQETPIADVLPVSTAEFRVNTTTQDKYGSPRIAMHSNGKFVVVWSGRDRQDTAPRGVYGQCYNNVGEPQGDEFQVNTEPIGDPIFGSWTYPAVVMDATGNFMVVWQFIVTSSDSTSMYGRRYNSACEPQGDVFQFSDPISADSNSPAVAMNATGQLSVAWMFNQAIFLRLYNHAGETQTTPIEVFAHDS